MSGECETTQAVDSILNGVLSAVEETVFDCETKETQPQEDLLSFSPADDVASENLQTASFVENFNPFLDNEEDSKEDESHSSYINILDSLNTCTSESFLELDAVADTLLNLISEDVSQMSQGDVPPTQMSKFTWRVYTRCLSRYKHLVHSLKKEITELKQENESLRKSTLERQEFLLEEHRDRLARVIQDHEKQLSVALERSSNSRLQAKGLHMQLLQTESLLQQAEKSSESKVQQMASEYLEKITHLEYENEALTSRVKETEHRNEELENQLQETRNENKELLMKLDVDLSLLRNQKKQAEETVSKLKTQNENLHSHLEKERLTNSDLTFKVNQNAKQASILESRLKSALMEVHHRDLLMEALKLDSFQRVSDTSGSHSQVNLVKLKTFMENAHKWNELHIEHKEEDRSISAEDLSSATNKSDSGFVETPILRQIRDASSSSRGSIQNPAIELEMTLQVADDKMRHLSKELSLKEDKIKSLKHELRKKNSKALQLMKRTKELTSTLEKVEEKIDGILPSNRKAASPIISTPKPPLFSKTVRKVSRKGNNGFSAVLPKTPEENKTDDGERIVSDRLVEKKEAALVNPNVTISGSDFSSYTSQSYDSEKFRNSVVLDLSVENADDAVLREYCGDILNDDEDELLNDDPHKRVEIRSDVGWNEKDQSLWGGEETRCLGDGRNEIDKNPVNHIPYIPIKENGKNIWGGVVKKSNAGCETKSYSTSAYNDKQSKVFRGSISPQYLGSLPNGLISTNNNLWMQTDAFKTAPCMQTSTVGANKFQTDLMNLNETVLPDDEKRVVEMKAQSARVRGKGAKRSLDFSKLNIDLSQGNLLEHHQNQSSRNETLCPSQNLDSVEPVDLPFNPDDASRNA